MPGWLASRRRRRILATPFPAGWDAIIDRNVALTHRLSDAERARLRDLVQVFVAEKHWEGCGDLALTEEMQVTIAAQACILVLGRDDSLYADVASILVYPSVMISPPRRLGTFEQPRSPIAEGHTILGEAMLGGPVILAWDSVLAGGREQIAGNVVFHELAHKIDMASGAVNGTPPLTRRERQRWATVMTAAYRDRHARLQLGIASVISAYGTTNEAEFFAVATETFFTRPDELALEAPALYALLSDFYRFVPVGPPPAIPLELLFS